MSIKWHGGKESACSAGDPGELGLIPGLRWPPGGGNGNSLQYNCLENPIDRGAWWATAMGSRRARHQWVAEHMCIALLENKPRNSLAKRNPWWLWQLLGSWASWGTVGTALQIHEITTSELWVLRGQKYCHICSFLLQHCMAGPESMLDKCLLDKQLTQRSSVFHCGGALMFRKLFTYRTCWSSNLQAFGSLFHCSTSFVFSMCDTDSLDKKGKHSKLIINLFSWHVIS